MPVDRVGPVEKAIGNGSAAWQEEGSAFVLAITCFNARACREPVARAALNGAGVPANRIAKQEALIGIAVEILVVYEEVAAAEVLEQPFGADGFDAKVHVRQPGKTRKIDTRIPHWAARRGHRVRVVV